MKRNSSTLRDILWGSAQSLMLSQLFSIFSDYEVVKWKNYEFVNFLSDDLKGWKVNQHSPFSRTFLYLPPLKTFSFWFQLSLEHFVILEFLSICWDKDIQLKEGGRFVRYLISLQWIQLKAVKVFYLFFLSNLMVPATI